MSKIHEKAMLVKLTNSMWYGATTDREAAKEVYTIHNVFESESGVFIKWLVSKTVLKQLFGIQRNAEAKHRHFTLPWTDNKYRILPSANFFIYREKMKEFETMWNDAVNELLSQYDTLLNEAKNRLNSLYKEGDFPTKETIIRKLRFSISIIPIPDVNDFRVDLAEDELKEVKKEYSQQLNEATENALNDIWQRLYSVVNRYVEAIPKFNPNEKRDKRNSFQESMVNNTIELCEMLPKLNITGNKELEKLRKEVVSKLTKNTAKTLREDEAERKSTLDHATEILNTMKPFIS